MRLESARAHLIGESLGGWIAVWTAIDHPDRIGKVIYTVGAHLTVPMDEATREKTQRGLENSSGSRCSS